MRHFILVKFNDSVNVQELVEPIKNLFNNALDIDGIDKIEVHMSNVNLPSRHDLMIEILLTPVALKVFDNSEIHKAWKSEYGDYIINKVVFDCD